MRCLGYCLSVASVGGERAASGLFGVIRPMTHTSQAGLPTHIIRRPTGLRQSRLEGDHAARNAYEQQWERIPDTSVRSVLELSPIGRGLAELAGTEYRCPSFSKRAVDGFHPACDCLSRGAGGLGGGVKQETSVNLTVW